MGQGMEFWATPKNNIDRFIICRRSKRATKASQKKEATEKDAKTKGKAKGKQNQKVKGGGK